ncbi:MAG: hypothetical protein ACK4VK_04515 [Aquificaceae bacterium]
MLEELEKLGYEPVCIAGGTIRKMVRADERAQRYKDIWEGCKFDIWLYFSTPQRSVFSLGIFDTASGNS